MIFIDQAVAEDNRLSTSFSLDSYSNYIWRGRDISKGFVLQPGIDLIEKQYGFNVMGNFDIKDAKLNELLYTLNYMTKSDDLALNFGLVYYEFTAHNHRDTMEAYVSMSAKFVVDAIFTIYYDFLEGKGGFFESDFSYSLPIGTLAKLKLASDFNMDMSNSLLGRGTKNQYFFNFYNGQLMASFIIKAANNFVIEPLAAYSYPLTKDAELNIKDEFFYGIRAKLAI
ncbi:MAG: hypothetical protein HQK93_00025 [Nitrospirae bacterium]|nr:hypothetical protein [Nitrospirota bacterium]